MKIPFDIEKAKSGKYRIETRDGHPVRIVCWDKAGGECIVALVKGYSVDKTDPREAIITCFDNGRYLLSEEGHNDLFLISDEPELTEFEAAVQEASFLEIPIDDTEAIRAQAKNLLDLAQKEIEASIRKKMADYCNADLEDLVAWDNGWAEGREIGFREGKAEALKDLPKWKKGKPKGEMGCIDISGLTALNFIQRNGLYMSMPNLDRLPKDE